MIFFNRQPKERKTIPTLDLSTTTEDRIEIQLAKEASKEAKQKVKEVNSHFKDLIQDGDEFHIKMYLAVGGKPRGGRK